MENNELDFSVVICCYNPNFEKLKKTIISIVKQKNVSFEIIISDDGSKENYLNKLESWINEIGLRGMKYNFLKENVGTVKNIISGMEKSEGKYIKIISPGDYLFNEYSLERYKKEFEDKNCSLIYSRAAFYDENGLVLNKYNPVLINTEKNRYLKRNVCFFMDSLIGATVACTRDMIKYLYEISGVVRLLEDYPMSYLALMNNEKVCFIKEYLIWYEYGTGISTQSISSKLENDTNKFLKFLSKNYSKNRAVLKSVKYLNLIRNYSGTKTTIKLSLLKPSYFFEVLHERIFKRFRKFPKVDFGDIDKITNLDVWYIY